MQNGTWKFVKKKEWIADVRFLPPREDASHHVSIRVYRRRQLFYTAIESDEMALIRFCQME